MLNTCPSAQSKLTLKTSGPGIRVLLAGVGAGVGVGTGTGAGTGAGVGSGVTVELLGAPLGVLLTTSVVEVVV